MLSIGLMSGTSMDGIDAALIETNGSDIIHEIDYVSLSYEMEFQFFLKAAEYLVRKYEGDIAKAELQYEKEVPHFLKTEFQWCHDKIKKYFFSLDEIIQYSTELHVIAIKKLLEKTGYFPDQIDVIGYHGQTLFHSPEKKISLSVGYAESIANQLGVPVVHDFRSNDIHAGGQGAPLAPLYHYALAMRDKKIPACVVNCGGIANITIIPTTDPLDLIAFDTGPGNGLIDTFIRQRTAGRENMDKDGHYGQQGKVDHIILKKLYEKSICKNNRNYFLATPPKSLDIGDMKLIPELHSLSLPDACRTLEAFTADTIVKSLELLSGDIPSYWILSGGGWNNPIIFSELENRLHQKFKKNISMVTADNMGWNSQAMEAQIFAYYAVRCLQHQPISFPGTTRVSKPMTGGRVYFPTTRDNQTP